MGDAFNFREASLARARAWYEYAEGRSPAALRAMKSEIEAVEAAYAARSSKEVQVLKADENERRTRLDEQWTEAANEAKTIRTAQALGDITTTEARDRIHKLMRLERDLQRQADALRQVVAQRGAIEADPVGYIENIMKKYPVPQERWTAFS